LESSSLLLGIDRGAAAAAADAAVDTAGNAIAVAKAEGAAVDVGRNGEGSTAGNTAEGAAEPAGNVAGNPAVGAGNMIGDGSVSGGGGRGHNGSAVVAPSHGTTEAADVGLGTAMVG
jgi:hypothetical protein